MKLTAHVAQDGSLRGLVAVGGATTDAFLNPQPGVQVCEIEDHGLNDEFPDLDTLAKLLENRKVEVQPARGTFSKLKD